MAEPVTLVEAKAFLRVDAPDEDTLIDSLITAARGYAETFTRRQFLTATKTLYLDAFPGGEILIPNPPLQQINSIQYVDSAGVTQTLAAANYIEDADSEPGRVTPAYGENWPVTREQVNAVSISYDCGYGAADDVPAGLLTAVKQLVAHWFEHREAAMDLKLAEVPMAIESLLWQYRVLSF